MDIDKYLEIINEKLQKMMGVIMRVKKAELVKCKYCGSDKVVRFGTYHGIQRWWCKDCKRKFTEGDTIFKMKTPIAQIGDALDCYYRGMSLDDIGEHQEQTYGTKLTDAGVYNWVIRFSDDAVSKAKKYPPNVGNVWLADETVLKIGGKNVWLWDIIDAKTRFLLATHLSDTRTTKDALILMKKAEEKAGKIPDIVLTDKLAAYLDGIELAWGAETKHIPSKGFRKALNTNLIERWHGILKDRTKVMRGLHNIKTAEKIINGWLFHYNYFRPHEGLHGKTPAEQAGIRFPHRNWLEIVKEKQRESWQSSEEEIEKYFNLARGSPEPKTRRLIRRKKIRRKRIPAKSIMLVERGL